MSHVCYLHVNGELIFKPAEKTVIDGIVESDLCTAMWYVSPDRMDMWCLLVEAAAAGADMDKLAFLADKWGATDEDALIFAKRVGLELERGEFIKWTVGALPFHPVTDPMGMGVTPLEAFALLCRKLRYIPGKPAEKSFLTLIQRNADEKTTN